jgi:hypothetical protein
MKVYHGSWAEIVTIDLEKCIPNKDFGRGFYVTKFRHHAENWAKIIGHRHHTEGFVTEFNFIEGAFTDRICKIKRFKDYSEEWLDFIVKNRDETLPALTHDFDIVEGPIADDKVQNRIGFYLNGQLSKADFLKELTYHEQTHQICFCTVASLQVIVRPDKNAMLNVVRIGESIVESLVLDREINEDIAADLFYNSTTFAQLTDTSTQFYKKTGIEIYGMLKKELTDPLTRRDS